jgi:hypothetical protein
MQLDQHFILSLFHITIIVPFFLYIGYVRANTSNWLYMTLITVGFVIFIYHGYKLALRLRVHSGYSWVNALHVLLVAPLLMYIGYNKKETPRFAYELLLILAFGAGGYHTMSLIRSLDAHPEPSN